MHCIVISFQSNNAPNINKIIKFVHLKNLECSRLGYYRDVLKDECVPCPFGTYSDTENAVNAESCNVCGKEQTASGEGSGNSLEEQTASGEGSGNNPERQTTSEEGSTSSLQCYLGIIIHEKNHDYFIYQIIPCNKY